MKDCCRYMEFVVKKLCENHLESKSGQEGGDCGKKSVTGEKFTEGWVNIKKRRYDNEV